MRREGRGAWGGLGARIRAGRGPLGKVGRRGPWAGVLPQGGLGFLIELLRNWWQARGHTQEHELPMSKHLTHPIRPAGRGLASVIALTLALAPQAGGAEDARPGPRC